MNIIMPLPEFLKSTCLLVIVVFCGIYITAGFVISMNLVVGFFRRLTTSLLMIQFRPEWRFLEPVRDCLCIFIRYGVIVGLAFGAFYLVVGKDRDRRWFIVAQWPDRNARHNRANRRGQGWMLYFQGLPGLQRFPPVSIERTTCWIKLTTLSCSSEITSRSFMSKIALESASADLSGREEYSRVYRGSGCYVNTMMWTNSAVNRAGHMRARTTSSLHLWMRHITLYTYIRLLYYYFSNSLDTQRSVRIKVSDPRLPANLLS